MGRRLKGGLRSHVKEVFVVQSRDDKDKMLRVALEVDKETFRTLSEQDKANLRAHVENLLIIAHNASEIALDNIQYDKTLAAKNEAREGGTLSI